MKSIEAFEHLMSTRYLFTSSDLADKCSEGSPCEGEYRDQRLQDFWEVWQEATREALSAPEAKLDAGSVKVPPPRVVDDKAEAPELCPESGCDGRLVSSPGGGVKCTAVGCDYWFCF